MLKKIIIGTANFGTKYGIERKIVSEKKIMYDHFADQRKSDKWNSQIVLQPLDLTLLPDYISKNKEKFKDWLDI